MRVIAGIHKGRKLEVPVDRAIRPTSERTRESLFNVLMHGRFGGACVIHQRVADICCGTGALGIEALSRGATHVTFVDVAKTSLLITERNLRHLGASQQATLIASDATRLPKATEPFALILLDPPYDMPILSAIAASLRQGGWVKTGSILAAEIASSRPIPELLGAELITERRYGKAKILIWEMA
ncbi:MAG: 16S rRNA (guanine(966)-N(2))-methyltransferase RsmD [Rickettsiales bacterium]|jgi:16S rRNA (guanine966-N2)-methyltransferase|nr:16S rRNA (guanine(966)-N(2))-methyltransferase RsmD [Rickettsiales bacterium]